MAAKSEFISDEYYCMNRNSNALLTAIIIMSISTIIQGE